MKKIICLLLILLGLFLAQISYANVITKNEDENVDNNKSEENNFIEENIVIEENENIVDETEENTNE